MHLPFRLYGLPGCPHCAEAELFCQQKKLPVELISVLGDPLIEAGVQSVTGKVEYPVLLSRLTNEIIVGYKEDDYARVWRVFDILIRTGSLSLDTGGWKSEQENSTEALPDATGTP